MNTFLFTLACTASAIAGAALMAVWLLPTVEEVEEQRRRERVSYFYHRN